jgi:hypothetical protein
MEAHPLHSNSSRFSDRKIPIEHSRPHKSATKLIPKSPSGSGHKTNLSCHDTCFWVGKTILLLTFPCSEKVGNILEAIWALVLNHRSRDTQERPYDQGFRIANTGGRRRGIMRVR